MRIIRGLSGKNIILELYERCPKKQRSKLHSFDLKTKEMLEKINKLPEKLPKIDWEYYMNNVRKDYEPMVKDFQKKYSEYKVPFPEEKAATQELETLRKEVEKDVQDYIAKSNEKIEKYKKEIERLKNMMPYDQMTWEDYIDNYPDEAPNFVEKPTFWPHCPTEQTPGPVGKPKFHDDNDMNKEDEH